MFSLDFFKIGLYNLTNSNWRLPQELEDLIFLHLNYSTLNSCRKLQSEFVKTTTMYYNLSDAVENGNLQNMKWLKEQGRIIKNGKELLVAVKRGNLEIAKWLKDEGYNLNEHVFALAASNGNLKNNIDSQSRSPTLTILKWLKEQNCPWDENTFSNAAQNGDLQVMKWLKEQNCPWDENTFSNAAQNGDLQVMKWLKEQGCPWDCYIFIYTTNLENWEWLKEQYFPLDETHVLELVKIIRENM